MIVDGVAAPRPAAAPARALVVVLGMVGAAVVGGSMPFGTVAAALIAVAAAAAVRLALGTSAGRPGLDDVARRARAARRPRARARGGRAPGRRGVPRRAGVDAEGRSLLVKVYGRDAYDTQLVAKLWRSVWYRGAGPAIGLGRLQSAEHEAFVTLLARNAGLATREVVTAGATVDDDALLVLRGERRRSARSSRTGSTTSFCAAPGGRSTLSTSSRSRTSRSTPRRSSCVGGEVGFVDFGAATVAPDAHQLDDRPRAAAGDHGGARR